jgi:hypothetical protein
MIRKVVAFVVLIAIGLLALHFAVGGESFGGRGSALTRRSSDNDAAPSPTSTGIAVPASGIGEGFGDTVVLTIRGEVELPSMRVQRTPRGIVELPIYRLKAKDSRTTLDAVVEFDDVEVDFFEIGGTPDEPRAVQTGRMTASRAYAKVGKDEKGRPSIQQDRDIDLRDVVFATEAESRIPSLKLVVAQAFVRNVGDRIDVRTTRDEEPFVLTMAGERNLRLTGKGLDASLPSARESADDRVELRVRSEPRLIHEDPREPLQLDARGELTYHERLSTGVASVAASDDVVVRGGTADAPIRAEGDRLFATLSRATEGDRDRRIGWRTVHFDGTPARLTSKDQQLVCRRLDVQLNRRGEPAWITAGGEPRLVSRSAEHGEITFHAERTIRVVRIDAAFGAIHRAYGFPRFAAGTRSDQLVRFDGRAELEGAGLAANAGDGLSALRSEHDEREIVLVGAGATRLTQRATAAASTTATGDDGFLLVRSSAGDRMRLGPTDPNVAGPFRIERGELIATGTGACRIEHATTSDRLVIDLASPSQDVTIVRGPGESVAQLRTLHAEVEGGELRAFDAEGDDCVLAAKTADGAVTGNAVRLTSDDPGMLRLHGDAHRRARLVRASGDEVTGAVLTLATLVGEHQQLRADGDARVVVREFTRIGGVASKPASAAVELDATTAVVHPFLLPPPEADPMRGFVPRALRRIVPLAGASLRGPVLHGRGDVRIRQDDAATKSVTTATGDEIWLPLAGGGGGLLVGAPARVTQAEADGASRVAVAYRIQMTGGDALRLLPHDGHLPQLDVPAVALPMGSTPAPGERLVLISEGPIDADASTIRFGGPVRGRTRDQSGAVVADGLAFEADGVSIEREPKTGALVRVTAAAGADLRSGSLTARGRNLVLDARRTTLTVEDPRGRAAVTGRSMQWLGRHVVVDYTTGEGSVWGARFDGGVADGTRH